MENKEISKIELNKIYNDDCLNILKEIDADSIDSIVTDAPYGIGMMQKKWDKALVSIEIWKECLRVLKPGAFMFCMSSPRQDVLARMIINLEDAGFNVNFTSIYWIFATGFPKALNVSKAIDKQAGVEREVIGTIKKMHFTGNDIASNIGWNRPSHRNKDGTVKKTMDITAPATEQAKQFEGAYGGFQPKPALENIIVVQKPMSEKTYVEQALKNGKGITWLDDCRIPYKNENDMYKESIRKSGTELGQNSGWNNHKNTDTYKKAHNKGRFPANILVQDDILSDGKNHPSGEKKISKRKCRQNICYGKMPEFSTYQTGISEGSFSRFFDLDSWAKENNIKDTFPFLIVPKPSRKEKEMGCEHLKKNKKYTAGSYSQSPICSTCDKTLNGINDHSECDGDVYYKDMDSSNIVNSHPTVKPIKLFSYLITLCSRKEDIILDPFCGSGTTCIAAKLLERKYIGIELNKEYYEIAKTRLDNIDIQGELF